MPKIGASVVINRPIGDIFAFLSDFEKWPQWVGEIVEAEKTSEGPVGVGTTFNAVVKFLGRRMDNAHVVSEYKPNSRLAVEVTSGPVPMQAEIGFESVADGTKVTMVAELAAAGFFKIAEPLVVRMGQRQYETNLANLKDLLETQGSS